MSKRTVEDKGSLILMLLFKWMIFCDPGNVDAVWAIVARATANDELGIAAKVAPFPEEGLQKRERLICIYTKDFRDRRDVGRVLRRLRELRLVESRGKILYYKPGMLAPPSNFPLLIADEGRHFHVHWARLWESVGSEGIHLFIPRCVSIYLRGSVF